MLLCGIRPAGAATLSWDGGPDGTGTNWNEAVNWGGDVKPGDTDVARFFAAGTSSGKVIVLGAPQGAGRLVFDGITYNLTVGGAGDGAAGNTLTLGHLFRQSNVGGVQTVAADVELATNSVWDVAAGYNSGVVATRAIRGVGRSLEKANSGTLTLAGTNAYTGLTSVRLGTLELGFNQSTAPATNILSDASALELNGGALKLSGKAGVVCSQAVSGTVVRAGASSLSIVNGNASGKTRLLLGGLSREVGGTVNFAQPTVNTAVGADNGYATTNANDAAGLLGAFATVGAANWAASDGVNIVAYGGYATVEGNDPALAGGATQNARISNASTGTVSLAGTEVTVNTLLASDAAPRTLSIGQGHTLRFGSLGGLLSPSGSGPLTLEGGTLTAGGAADAAGELIFQNAAVVTNSAVIADNGAGAVALTKSGTGTLVLTVAAAHTGGTCVNAGALLLPGGVNPLSTQGLLRVTGGTLNLGGAIQTNTAGVAMQGGLLTNGTLVKLEGDYAAQAGVIRAKLEGPVGLSKTTSGALTLSGANTYTGETSVLEGPATLEGNAIVKGALVVGSPDGLLPASVFCVSTPLSQSKPWTVYANGSLNTGDSAQYLASTLTLMGGSFSGKQPYFQNGSAVKMTGGNLGGSIYGSSFNIASFASASSAWVSAGLSHSHTFTVEDGPAVFDLIYSGGHNGAGRTLTKAGPGVMALATVGRSYTGTTAVNAGTLLVNNTNFVSGTGNSAVTVAGGATLGGTGFIGGVAGYGSANVTVAGAAGNPAVVWPGSRDAATGAHVAGTLTVGNLAVQTNNVTFGANSTLRITLDAAGQADRLVVNGTLSLATATDTLEMDVADAEALPAGTYPLVTFQQLAAEGQVFDAVTGKPERGTLVYTATGIDYVVTAPAPKGTVIRIY